MVREAYFREVVFVLSAEVVFQVVFCAKLVDDTEPAVHQEAVAQFPKKLCVWMTSPQPGRHSGSRKRGADGRESNLGTLTHGLFPASVF